MGCAVIKVSHDGKHIYVTASNANKLIKYDRNSADGTVSSAVVYDFPSSYGPTSGILPFHRRSMSSSLAPTRSCFGRAMRATARCPRAVAVFRNGPIVGGLFWNPRGIAISPDGKNLYVGTKTADGSFPMIHRPLYVFDRGANDGTLSVEENDRDGRDGRHEKQRCRGGRRVS